ncbi:MAG TPA: efflux RND transporter periplasmic adaptor subunit [Gemmatimonadaceae bacterium]|nr:efflux RND transporter periplasmic adaptor subunit [Gemmatimonadaceae bacterium]
MTRLLRSRWLVPLAVVLILGGSLAWYFAPSGASVSDAITAHVKRGTFHVSVTTSGELQAQHSVKILGPAGAMQAQVYQIKITSIIPEGTVVKKGDVVAQLDRSTIAGKIADDQLAVQKADAEYTKAQLDSALNLSEARQTIVKDSLDEEQKQIAKDQSTYEAPSIKRQVEIDLEQARRTLAQAKTDYVTKTKQAVAQMREAGAELAQQKNKLQIAETAMQGFTIRAPAPGMVIYLRDWQGQKIGQGDQINAFDPEVATLPDLRHMESVTYVNEVDVRKVAVGQHVTLGLDADPAKQLTGKVTNVANVGEQRPNSDAKVFEVKIAVDQSDTTLRPGMTTSNAIETATVPNALFVPLEAVSIEGTTPYVFKKDGGRVVRQQVETGVMNDNDIVVRRGLAEGDQVLLSVPANADQLPVEHLAASAPKRTAAPGTDAPDSTRIAPAKRDSSAR